MGSSNCGSGRARHRDLASRQRPVPRGRTRARRPCSRGRGGHLPRHHFLLRLAVEDRCPRPRRASVPDRRRPSLLSVPVPQPHAPGRGRRGRASRRQARARRAEPRPRPAGRRLGAHCWTGRPGTADDRRPLRPAVTRALVHAVRGSRAPRNLRGRRSRCPYAIGTGAFPVGAGAERGGGRYPRRSASQEGVASGRAYVDRGRPRLCAHVPDRRPRGWGRPRRSPGSCLWHSSR